ncbi:RNA-binding protein [Longilinea arvoryzae]|uniref:RNA-binding protein n=1 Tax=Longilinea arvoryzae TaxID=360412 RepID=A0A0S7BCB2_9CHLR|nr:RNA-binding protein [Longilinea arvoryzae]GAP15487.1 RNA-binding protein [Longilinea arvoryzae]
MNIYVGNLSYQASEDELRQAFEAFGEVVSVSIIKDKLTGQSRGFAFVEMGSDDAGRAAITGMNGKDFHGRALTVNEARPREERRPGGDRGGFGGGYRSGSGGGGYGNDRRGGTGGGRRTW